MKANERRQQILALLQTSQEPLAAGRLAKELKVSRQIIVGDVALLRAESHDIIATHRGYLLSEKLQPLQHQFQAKVVCKHGSEAVQEEFELIIANGGRILDVEVEHPLYGLITAPLNIGDEEDIAFYLSKLADHKDSLLSRLTDGIHLHTIACQDKATFDRITAALDRAAISYKGQ